MMRHAGDREPRSILVTRLRFLGDVILTLPAVGALREAFPGAAIDYLCESPYDQILGEITDLRRVLVLRRGEEGAGESFSSLLGKIRGEYELVVDLFGNPRSAWITGLSGAGLRVGRGKFPRSLAYNRRPGPGEAGDSALVHHLRTLEPVIGARSRTLPRLTAPDQERRSAQRMLEDRGLGEGCIAILTGATHPSKEWPESSFVRLAAQIRMDGRYRPVFLGQPGKRERLERIRALSNSQVVILPELELKALMGLLASCRALVCCDGGIMHLALALGLPTLALFGPTEPEIWFPYGGADHAELLVHPADCRPCHRHVCEDPFCLEELDPELAFSRLLALIDRTDPS
jgi:ADP-heptose:LPS heptosyltransferase